MSKSHLHLLFLSLLLLPCVSHSTFTALFNFSYPIVGLVACRPHQIQAFTQFKNEFNTHNCDHSDDLNGVWCDNATGAITKLRLRDCLSGTLKPNSSLFRFHQLRDLDLSHNNFISTSLPSEFGDLNRLGVLRLSFNSFFGQISSSFSNLSLLSLLDLSNNKLSGGFPLVRNLSNLRVLDISHNHFSGTLNPNNSLFGLHHLRYLNLGYNMFSSSLPPEFGNLNKLEVLCLSSNGFVGQVPSTIRNLTWLNNFYLDQNNLTGSFPLVQNLTKLSILQLNNNQLSGTIPSSLFSLPFLFRLSLNENHLSGSVEVPNSSSSSRLEDLFLGDNQFEGQILEPISKLINLKGLDLSFLNTNYPLDLNPLSSLNSLEYLDLSDNNISQASLSSNSYIPLTLETLTLVHCGISEFPNILKTLAKLEYIELSYNRIKGKIPEWLWSLPRLNTLDIRENFFNGFEGSAEVLVNSSMRLLFMDSNNFEGALPNLPRSIGTFSAESNGFTGEIPLSICSISSLDVLGLQYNNFTGSIPQCLGKFTFVNLRSNSLEGSIPDVFYANASLVSLDVGFNRLTGKLPRSLVNCSSLKFLSFDNNRIEDTFPFWLKASPNLQVLILRSNNFYGPISPPHQGPLGFPQLQILEISGNKFSGSLPPTYFVNWKAPSLTMNEDGGLYMIYEETLYGDVSLSYTNTLDLQYKGLHMEQERILTSYSTIDFSGNLLQGQIPESIGLLKALIALNLSNNAFTGHIPLSLANLKELESLDLSGNQLSGTIPNGLGSLSFLAYINVSHNQLNGEIPQGTQITGQSISSFEGNAGLCGLPLKERCFGTSTPPMQHHKPEDEEEQVLNWKAVAIGYGSGVLFGLAVAQVIASYKPEWLARINAETVMADLVFSFIIQCLSSSCWSCTLFYFFFNGVRMVNSL